MISTIGSDRFSQRITVIYLTAACGNPLSLVM